MDAYTEENVKGTTIIKINRPSTSSFDAGKFKDYLLSLLFKGKKKIVIDVCDVEHLDSAFLGAVLISRQILEASNVEFTLVNSGDNGYIWSLLQNSPLYDKLQDREKFMKTLDSAEDPDEALED